MIKFHHTLIFRMGLSGAILFILLLVTIPVFIEFAINLAPVKSRLSQEIKKISGMDLSQDKIEFLIYPRPGIRFSDIVLGVTPRVELSMDSAVVYPDFSQLLEHGIVPRRITVHGPRLHVPSSLFVPSSQKKEQWNPITGLSWDLVNQFFQMLPKSRKDIDITIRQGTCDYFSNADAGIRVSAGRKGIAFTADINKIHLQKGQIKELDNLLQGKIEEFAARKLSVTLKLSHLNTVSGQINLNNPLAVISGQDKPIAATEDISFKFFLSTGQMTADLAPCRFKYPQIQAGAHFEHDIVSGKTRLAFQGTGVNISQARTVCLTLFKGNRVVDHLFSILRSGRTGDVLVAFDASELNELFDGTNLEIKGSAEHAQVKIPEVPLMVEQVSGRASMENGVLHLETGHGRIQAANIQKGILDINIVNHSDIPFHGKFNLTADLSSLPDTLMNLLPGTNLAMELAQLSDIKGSAQGVLELNKASGAKNMDIRVSANNIAATGNYNRIPLPLSLSQGKFGYDTNGITLAGIKGAVGSNTFSIESAAICLDPPFEMKIQRAGAAVSTRTLLDWAKSEPSVMAALFPVKLVSGPITLNDVQILGPLFFPNQWNVTLKGDAEKINLGFRDEQMSVTDLSCHFDMTGDGFNVRKINGQILDLTWLETKYEPDISANIKFPLAMTQGIFQQGKKNNCSFQATLQNQAGPLVGVNLTGKSIDSLQLKQINIKETDLTDTNITLGQMPDSPVIDIAGHLDTSSLEKILVKDAFFYNQLNLYTAGTPLALSVDPSSSQLLIHARQIDIEGLLPDKNNAVTSFKKVLGGRPLIPQKKISFKADTLFFKGKTFANVDSRINLKPDKTKVIINHAGLCGLDLSGQLTFFKNTVKTSLKCQSQIKKKASLLFSCLFGSKSVLEGQYTLNAQIEGNESTQLIARNQNGTLSFQANQGRIYKATILSRVLSVLNILGKTDIFQHGFAYNRLNFSSDIKNSVIHIKNMYIDAENMAIIATGQVDPFNDKIDMTFLVAPFKTIDTIIQRIPLVNTILSGRLVSLPAKAQGKLSDPTVIPLHPSAVGQGLVTLFGDLLKAPVRLFTGENNNNE